MTQNRTHNCGELRAENAGERVRLVGWMENVREVSSSLSFVVLRDFYGTTQLVCESEDMIAAVKRLNKESTIAVEGVVTRATVEQVISSLAPEGIITCTAPQFVILNISVFISFGNGCIV